MTRLSPDDIRSLRFRLGWSAREMGALFDRSHATIYHWERGETTPGATVMAAMAILRDDLAWREKHRSKTELEEWKSRIAREGVEELLRNSSVSSPSMQAPTTTEDLIDRASRNGGLIVKSSDGTRRAFIMPFTKEGLMYLVRGMLSDNKGEDELESNLSSFANRIETDLH